MHFVDHFVHFVDNSGQSSNEFSGQRKFAVENERRVKRLLMIKNSPISLYNTKNSIYGTLAVHT
jgi:hypothetical protein